LTDQPKANAKFQQIVQLIVIAATLLAGIAGGMQVPLPEDPPVVPCQCDEVVPDPEPETAKPAEAAPIVGG
jgi:hypothetical protein